MNGEILYFDEARGIGFIAGKDGNRYVFERADLVDGAIPGKGWLVTFRAAEDNRAREVGVPGARGTPATASEPGAAPPHPAEAAPEATLGMWDCFRRCVTTHYARFRGRARRKEYWSFAVFAIIAYAAAWFAGYIIDRAAGNTDALFFAWLGTTLAMLALLLPGLAVTIRRQHDIGLSGWFFLLVLIPTIGPLIILVFTLVAPQKHDNKWGPAPAGAG